MPLRTLLLIGLIVAAGASVLPPVIGQQGTFRSGSGALVPIFATVLDGQQRLVPNLVREDFEVLDNDKPQPIVLFADEIQPITVVVMLDTSGSMTSSIALLKTAAEQFLIRLLPADQGRVGAFNDKIDLNSRFTNNRDELISAVKDLDFGNGTRLWDAVALSLDELQGKEGRRVILVFTDGDDTSSKVRMGTVMDRARADEVMIYAIGLESTYGPKQQVVRTRPDGGLKKIADETGGGYFELKKTADLAPTFTRVAQELHSQYVVGIEAKQLDGKVHKLAVRMKQPGMSARARRSYLAVPDKLSSTR
ncbi:MAG: VWA domain-containing protein [Acidobacteriota bacterium]